MDHFQDLKYKYLQAEKDSNSAYTLLLLHGTGGDENDLIPLAARFGKGINVLSLRGNVQEHGMPRFFKRLGMGVFDEEDLQFRTHELVDFLKRKSSELGFDLSKVVALGYSNGANIAGGMLMLYPDLLAGAILWRAMLPLKNKTDFMNTRKTPILMTSGASDPTIPLMDSKNWEYLLARNQFEVQHEVFYTGHHLTEEDIETSLRWFERFLKIA